MPERPERPERAQESFDEALAVEVAGDGHLVAQVAEGWDVRGNPHGGYLLALVATAMGRAVSQPDPLTISASYLAPPRTGPADLHIRVLRAGRRQSTAAVELVQDGTTRVHTVATFGRLPDEDPTAWTPDVAAPTIPPPEDCLAPDLVEEAEGEVINLHRRLLLRCHPRTGWLRGAPSGVAELEGWLRFADGRAPDPVALLMFSDGMPPSLFEVTGRDVVGHVPTVQLTTHLFARPADGWVQARFRTRVQGGSFVDEDGELWDANGRLVATTRQLALGFRARTVVGPLLARSPPISAPSRAADDRHRWKTPSHRASGRQGRGTMPTVSELTAKFIEVLDAKDVEGLRALGLDDVSFVTADFDGSAGTDFVDYLGKWTTGFPDYRLEAGPIITDGPRAAYSWVFRGTNTGPLKTDAGELPPTGKAVAVTLLGTAVWDGGKLKEMYMVWDQLLMMQQLGLT